MPYGTIDPNISRPDINPADRNNLAIKAGYTGYEDYLNNSATTQPGVGGMTPTTPTIDLPSIYKSLTDSSGIGGLQNTLSTQEKSYNDALSKINDNPFLSEANRVGRAQKLTTDYTNATANLRNDITTKKADIETQLNLQTKQFDINSQQAKTSFDQFNSLLSSGALANASPQDIANITRSTGISSTMIQAAINKSKEKNVKTETIKWDDGTNQGYAIVDSNTGNIISKQAIAKSEPKNKTVKEELTPTKKEEVIKSSRTILTGVDKNKDKSVSAQEYIDAVNKVMMDKNISEAQADEYVTQAMKDLKFTTWKWKK